MLTVLSQINQAIEGVGEPCMVVLGSRSIIERGGGICAEWESTSGVVGLLTARHHWQAVTGQLTR
jgi:hypothetical protein